MATRAGLSDNGGRAPLALLCPERVADLVLVENAHEISRLGAEFTRKPVRLRRSIVGDDGLCLRVIWIPAQVIPAWPKMPTGTGAPSLFLSNRLFPAVYPESLK